MLNKLLGIIYMNILKKLFKKQTIIQTTLTITSSNGFHIRPIAQFTNEVKSFHSTITILAHNQEVLATQTPKLLALSLDKGESFTLRCVGEDAKEASEHLSAFFIQLMKEDKEVEEIEQEVESYEAFGFRGQSVAKGVAIAPIVRLEKIEEVAQHKGLSLQEAIAQTSEELSILYKNLYEENRAKEEAQIFLAQKELLNSELFQEDFERVEEEIEKLKGTKFESRIADYQDLKQKVLSHMGTTTKLNLPDIPYILLAEELLPSEISILAQTPIEGVISQKGTTTSHASILLRSFAIPSVIIKEEISPSPKAILDANSGDLILEPTEGDVAKAQEKQKRFKSAQEQSHQNRFNATQTKTGKSIKILANITNLASAKEAKELGADGVGLLRTEFLFTQKQPTIEEQTKAYGEIFELFDEITVRTLDIGGDKSLPYIDIAKEDNPFLGIRGIRFSLQEQTLFKEQLLAIGLSSSNTKNKKIKIMFPMVSTTEEFMEAKAIALETYQEKNISLDNIAFGIMLEVPSVIFALKKFDALVDFYSIGSNDLTQYLFAIERTHPTLNVDATSPMLMSALRQIKKSSKKSISICGEVAGLEEATKELLEMGYDTLSISATLIPTIKEIIRKL